MFAKRSVCRKFALPYRNIVSKNYMHNSGSSEFISIWQQRIFPGHAQSRPSTLACHSGKTWGKATPGTGTTKHPLLFNAGIKSPRATLPDKILNWGFCFLNRAFRAWRSQITTHHVTRHNTPIHNILSTAPQLSISQKALGTLPEDGNVMPKYVGATIRN
jgi:hypothetical protein